MSGKQRVAVFGASGTIGAALGRSFFDRDWDVVAITRTGRPSVDALVGCEWIAWNPFVIGEDVLKRISQPFDAVVWAQGQNFNDSIQTFNASAHEELYQANVVYVMQTLHALLSHNLLTIPARLCIISSIWQNIARQNKLSYTVTKSALQGLVQSLTIDLGKDGHLVNAVLPGALDTPMTRANLTVDQVRRLEEATPIGKLATVADVCNLTTFLCSSDNTGITGQFIAVDKGFSFARII